MRGPDPPPVRTMSEVWQFFFGGLPSCECGETHSLLETTKDKVKVSVLHQGQLRLLLNQV